MIPAGIAFAEEEVIIIEEPVAAEEVVEEVVEVEPVEVEPVEEVEPALVDKSDTTLDWSDMRTHLEDYIIYSVPTCESEGTYALKSDESIEGKLLYFFLADPP